MLPAALQLAAPVVSLTCTFGNSAQQVRHLDIGIEILGYYNYNITIS